MHGLAHPFSLAFLPNGDALVTERGAKLRLVHGVATRQGAQRQLDPEPVAGAPEAGAFRGGGHRRSRAASEVRRRTSWVYFTYNKPGAGMPNSNPPGRRQAAVALARGQARREEAHRRAGALRRRVGERQQRLAARVRQRRPALHDDRRAVRRLGAEPEQRLRQSACGCATTASLPPDNPFVGKAGARPEIFTYGHRDQLGLTVHAATGSVLERRARTERRRRGQPASAGAQLRLAEVQLRPQLRRRRGFPPAPLGEGIEQPLILWLPSIAPTGLTFYTGDRFPTWKGNLFVGSARVGEIPRTGALERVVVNDKLEELRRERLLSDLHQRIRDVRQGPDGLLYVITDEDDGALLRIEPAAL